MRGLIVVILVVGLGWGGYWLLSAQTREQALTGWMEARRAEGWQADWRAIDTGGFPDRLRTTLHDIELADPQTGWAWQAPRLQVTAPVYSRTDVLVTLPGDSTLATPRGRYHLQGDSIRAALSLGDRENLTLNRGTWVIDRARVTAQGGQTWRADQVRLVAEQAGPPQRYHLELAVQGAAASAGKGLDAVPVRADADVIATFDRPWDRRALEQRRPQPTALRIDSARASWGALNIRVAGQLRIAASGTPDGRLTVKVENWREVLALATENGAIPPELEAPVTAALNMASRLAGHPETLDLPLDFRNGRMFLGPLPIGDAPPIRLR